METWLCAGWVLSSSGDMALCWAGVDQQGDMGVCAVYVLISNRHMGVRCKAVLSLRFNFRVSPEASKAWDKFC